jgi:hypothetical protein
MGDPGDQHRFEILENPVQPFPFLRRLNGNSRRNRSGSTARLYRMPARVLQVRSDPIDDLIAVSLELLWRDIVCRRAALIHGLTESCGVHHVGMTVLSAQRGGGDRIGKCSEKLRLLPSERQKGVM